MISNWEYIDEINVWIDPSMNLESSVKSWIIETFRIAHLELRQSGLERRIYIIRFLPLILLRTRQFYKYYLRFRYLTDRHSHVTDKSRLQRRLCKCILFSNCFEWIFHQIVKGIESLPQTLIFKSPYLCKLGVGGGRNGWLMRNSCTENNNENQKTVE